MGEIYVGLGKLTGEIFLFATVYWLMWIMKLIKPITLPDEVKPEIKAEQKIKRQNHQPTEHIEPYGRANHSQNPFKQMSLWKLAFLLISGGGGIYWFYLQWMSYAKSSSRDLSPFWRTLLAFLWTPSLLSKISSDERQKHKLIMVGVMYPIGGVLMHVSSTLVSESIFSNYAIPLSIIWYLGVFMQHIPLFYFQNKVNAIPTNKANDDIFSPPPIIMITSMLVVVYYLLSAITHPLILFLVIFSIIITRLFFKDNLKTAR